MKKIVIVDVVGYVICYDIIRIVKDVVKDRVFKKGYIVREEDIFVLLLIGKEYFYVWEKEEGMFYENEVVEILYDICKNENFKFLEVKEGKVEVIVDIDGLFRVDVDRLDNINEMEEIMIVIRYINYLVKKGDKFVGIRVILFVVEEEKLKKV